MIALEIRLKSACLSLRSSAAAAAHLPAAHLSKAQEAAAQLATTNHALAYGFSKGFLVSAGIMLLGLIIGLVLVRVKREDLEGINPMAAPVDTIPESADAIPATAD